METKPEAAKKFLYTFNTAHDARQVVICGEHAAKVPIAVAAPYGTKSAYRTLADDDCACEFCREEAR